MSTADTWLLTAVLIIHTVVIALIAASWGYGKGRADMRHDMDSKARKFGGYWGLS